VKIGRRRLLSWHVWLGWLIGIPLVIWTVSGLVMVARPIEEVRGTDLRAELAPIRSGSFIAPAIPPAGLESLTLRQTPLGPRWIVVGADEKKVAADPRTGLPLPALTRVQAEAAALAYRKDPDEVASVRYTPSNRPPFDLRQPRPAWGVEFSDGSRFYIDADTGELLAVRTDFWRFFDFMWGLHILDPQTREDTHHPILVAFSVLAAIGAVLGCVLMGVRYWPKRRRSG
jgi:hypothetical protein